VDSGPLEKRKPERAGKKPGAGSAPLDNQQAPEWSTLRLRHGVVNSNPLVLLPSASYAILDQPWEST
jgi:hypothetical protein